MLGSIQQRLLLRQRSLIGVGYRLLPGIVPQGQNAAHGHVDLAAGEGVVFFAVLQQFQNPAVHFYRGNPRLIVYRFQVGHPIVFVVNVEQLVIFQQFIMECLGLLLKRFLRFGVTQNGGYRIEQGQERGLVLLGPLGRRRSGAAGEKAQGAQQGNQRTAHRIKPPPWRSGPGNRPRRWSRR